MRAAHFSYNHIHKASAAGASKQLRREPDTFLLVLEAL
jgi:hypothetical protein